MIHTANKHPTSLAWHLRKGTNNLTHCILLILSQVTLSTPDTRILCYHWSELLWDHILHSPIHGFCWCALYLESTSPLSSLVQNLLLPSRVLYDSSSRRVTGPHLNLFILCTSQAGATFSLVWHSSMYMSYCATGLKLLKGKDCILFTFVFPTTST